MIKALAHNLSVLPQPEPGPAQPAALDRPRPDRHTPPVGHGRAVIPPQRKDRKSERRSTMPLGALAQKP